ncbi:hypothetical protein CLV51_103729 [Chitinophaga niastensis]|uniref:DUF5683 domain-containing protein n=2 Tax=Chitinophaga niastensis TaxID=536980 RepID=A0A2P8HKK5_CHINA|nr:hypothetical protein CLV51_103729 [Chitinophaga niastensis]
MFHSLRYFFLVLLTIVMSVPLRAQHDTLRPAAKTMDTVIRLTKAPGTDTLKSKHYKDSTFAVATPLPHSPRKAALYSAVLPGLGQAYNREYWKIPLVYAALGTCTYFFIDNMKLYKSFRDAYRIRKNGNPGIVDQYANLIQDAEGLKQYRDYYRQNVDYSVLFFVLAYGLNIADATVFAHLRTFDMSSDLSMRISPTLINNRTLGIGVNISLGGKKAGNSRYVAGR